MSIFILEADAVRFRSLALASGESWETFRQFDGRPLAREWRAVSVRLFENEDARDNDLPCGDFPAFASHVPVFSQRAVVCLGTFLTDNGELLPLQCPAGEYFAYNVTRLPDILDLDRSELRRFRAGGRIMKVIRHAFRAVPRELTIFKIPQLPLMFVYTTDLFVKAVLETKLDGFQFRRVGATHG